ncbi:hypothetical protein D1007_51945 [Hordeum vulgare]|nr:hypothetical protein D1007_51945 [Hordeum vulgare]
MRVYPIASGSGLARGRGAACARSTSSTLVDPEEALLVGVLCRSLTRTEMDARRLRHKNAEAVQLAIQLSEREATKEAATNAKATHHAKEQDHLLRRLSGMRCSSNEADNDVSITSGSDDDDDDASPHADAYTEDGHSGVDDQKGKGTARKW